jgi:glycosyltransferase involved in cell wall biosynthesis
VDSGSNPECANELSQLATKWGALLVRCDKPGLSLARNAAAAAISAEWIVYLDDDAVPAPDWAEKLLICLSTCPAEVGIVGGMIRPKWPNDIYPPQITERWKLLLSCTDKPGRGSVPEEHNICGANLAVRQSALALAGGFATDLGRVGNRLISGEEPYLIDWLKQRNISAIYDDSFSVDHFISEERIRPSWVAKRAYWEGFFNVRMLQLLNSPLPRFIRIPKFLASIPLLALLALVSIDFRIRLNIALGTLATHFSPPRPKPTT